MATTLRQQLMITRSLRQLRTWAPPISIGVIVGVGAFLAADRLDPPRAPQPAPITYASPARTHAVYVAQPQQAAQSLQIAGYANCDAARAAGAAPIYRGEPDYDIHLDRDRDGIACEPYPR